MDGQGAIGPALPPGFVKLKHNDPDSNSPTTSNDKSRTIGPALPPSLSSREQHSSDSESDSDDSLSGSDSSDQDDKPSHIIGPVIPSNLKTHHKHKKSKMDSSSHIKSKMEPSNMAVIGPIMPSGSVTGPVMRDTSSGEESDGGFGPRPPAPGQANPDVAEEFEKRAEKMKHRLLHGEEKKAPERETWMTELPSGGLGKHMGLTARKLGKGSAVKYEDQSVWTDTPADRERKQQEELEGRGKKRSHDEGQVRSQRDLQLAEQIDHYNKKKRAESLMDMHAKKLKKEKKKEDKKKKKEKKKKSKKDKKNKKKSEDEDVSGRVPFDRDRDLKVNRFDSAQKNALIKRSQELNTRFSAGAKQFI